MIPLTINLIAFALSAFALILAVVVNRRLIKRNKELRNIVWFNEQSNTRYFILTAEMRQERIRYEIMVADDFVDVNKVVGNMRCGIKRFTDPDQSFNQREAEELVEKLNEK